MQGLLVLKGFTLKKIKGNFCARKLKISIVIKNVVWSELLLQLFFPNSFTYNQAEQIKKGVICVQICYKCTLLNTVDFIFKVGQL